MQSKAYVNNNNELEIIDKQSISKLITFENSHLVAEYLIAKHPDVANALYEELKSQRKVGA